jgi:26S proteasome regulatory subunit N5
LLLLGCVLLVQQSGKLSEALELLLGVERNCRVGNDHVNLKEIVLTMVRLCHKVGDWEQLNTTATLLSKRRGQQGRTITAMVQVR